MSSNPTTRPPFLLVLYQQYLTHQDSACFVREVSCLYTTGTLERLARHACREVRRAAVLSLGFVGDYGANHTLGGALLDDDRTVRTLAENGIRTIWTRAGSDTDRQELGAVIRLNAARVHREAIARATKLIERAPWFAEAWHQRAVAYAVLGRLVESIRDCHQLARDQSVPFRRGNQHGPSLLAVEKTLSRRWNVFVVRFG